MAHVINDIALALQGVFSRPPHSQLPIAEGLSAIVAHAAERASAMGLGAGRLLAPMVAALPPDERRRFDELLLLADAAASRYLRD